MTRKPYSKRYSLADKQEIMELMKRLYGEERDLGEIHGTPREGRTTMASTVPRPTPDTQKLLPENQ